MMKTIKLILPLWLLLFLLFGCQKEADSAHRTPQNIERPEYSIFVVQSTWAPPWDEYEILNELQEMANISISWVMHPIKGVSEKINLMFAVGELTDGIMPQGRMQLNDYEYGVQGLLAPLNGLIQNMPNVQNMLNRFPETYKVLTAPDGQIYTLPLHHTAVAVEASTGDMISVNKAWLDKLEMKTPATLDEFYKMLVLFKNEDPNGNGRADEIPLTFSSDNEVFQFFGSFGVPINYYSYIYVNDREELIFVPIQEGYKEGIKYLHKLYSEGLMDGKVFINSTKDIASLGRAEEMIIGSFISHHMSGVVGTKRALDNYIIIPPMSGPHGDRLWPNNAIDNNIKAGYFALSTSCDNPEELMPFIDLFYEPNISFRIQRGPEFTMKEIGDDLLWKQQPPDGLSEGEFFIRSIPGWFAPGFYDPEIYARVVQNANVNLRKEAYHLYKDSILKHAMPTRVYMNETTMRRYATITPDLSSYVNRTMIQWISEGGIEEEWDEYKETLNRIGLEEFMDISRQSYTDYNK